MRFLATVILLCGFLIAASQNKDSIAAASIQYPVRGYVVLTNGSKIDIEGISYVDSSNVMLFTPGPNIINGVYTYKGDLRTMKKTTVPINQIQLLKARRQGFLRGASATGSVGFAAGFGLGYYSHFGNTQAMRDENGWDRTDWGITGGIILGAPSALIGGLGGSIFTKRRFRINGEERIFHKGLQRIFK